MNDQSEQIKKDILGFIKSDADIAECIAYFNCTGKQRFILKTLIEYGRNGLKGGGFSEEQIIRVINSFDEFASKDEVINQFLNSKKLENRNELEEIKKSISRFYIEEYEDNLKNKEYIEESGMTNNKVLVKKNGDKRLYIEEISEEQRKNGFVGAILISVLAATIEITTVLYIFLNGM